MRTSPAFGFVCIVVLISDIKMIMGYQVHSTTRQVIADVLEHAWHIATLWRRITNICSRPQKASWHNENVQYIYNLTRSTGFTIHRRYERYALHGRWGHHAWCNGTMVACNVYSHIAESIPCYYDWFVPKWSLLTNTVGSAVPAMHWMSYFTRASGNLRLQYTPCLSSESISAAEVISQPTREYGFYH